MGVFEVHSTLSVRSLKKRSRADLRRMLDDIAGDKRLTNEDVAMAIVKLSDRLG